MRNYVERPRQFVGGKGRWQIESEKRLEFPNQSYLNKQQQKDLAYRIDSNGY